MQAQHPSLSSDQIPRRQQGHAPTLDLASRSASFDRRTRADADSWVEISSQPSSSSLSSINDEVVTTGLRVQQDPRYRRRRTLRPKAPSHLNIEHRAQSVGASSQEEYEESESESDRVMTSSGEGGLQLPGTSFGQGAASEDDDENRTAINYPIRNDACFTPQPNAFSHPPSSQGMRNASAPVPGSYFPSTRPTARPHTRQSYPSQQQQSHVSQNPLSPTFHAAAQHDEALRASLSTLLSVAAAARGQSKPDAKRTATATAPVRRSDPMTFRLVPESALRQQEQQVAEPTFLPTLPRRTSTSTSASSASQHRANDKRKVAPPRSPTRDERRASKKARRSASNDDLQAVSPTLLTWVVSAGVVVVLSAALGFGAGYSLGKEAGRLEVEQSLGVGSCAREAGRGMGLKRSLARGAVTAV